MNQINNKPWIDKRGRHLPIDKIKSISANWDQETWAAYANSLEYGTDGILMTPRRFHKVAESKTENIFELYAQTSAPEDLAQLQKEISQVLTPRQIQVVDLVFFQGRSLEEAGQIMGLGKTTVYDHLQRALLRLKASSAVRANDLILMRGRKNDETAPLSREEQILEVFHQESQRCTGNNYGFKEGA